MIRDKESFPAEKIAAQVPHGTCAGAAYAILRRLNSVPRKRRRNGPDRYALAAEFRQFRVFAPPHSAKSPFSFRAIKTLTRYSHHAWRFAQISSRRRATA
jgi:hypothetical protein